MLLLPSAAFLHFFSKKFFQEYYQSVNQFGHRSGPEQSHLFNFGREQNHLCNFGRRHYEEDLCELILNMDLWFRRCCLKTFLI